MCCDRSLLLVVVFNIMSIILMMKLIQEIEPKMWCYSYMKIIVLEVKYILFAFALSAYIIAAIEKEARVDI